MAGQGLKPSHSWILLTHYAGPFNAQCLPGQGTNWCLCSNPSHYRQILNPLCHNGNAIDYKYFYPTTATTAHTRTRTHTYSCNFELGALLKDVFF